MIAEFGPFFLSLMLSLTFMRTGLSVTAACLCRLRWLSSVIHFKRYFVILEADFLNEGIVPAVILIVFFGIFALYTAKLLIDFKAGKCSLISVKYTDFFRS
jgi:hypothetical protein